MAEAVAARSSGGDTGEGGITTRQRVSLAAAVVRALLLEGPRASTILERSIRFGLGLHSQDPRRAGVPMEGGIRDHLFHDFNTDSTFGAPT